MLSQRSGTGRTRGVVNVGVNNPYVRVIEGSPDEARINEALVAATATGARLMSMTAFGEDGHTAGVILLFESKPEVRTRVPNDTSAIGG